MAAKTRAKPAKSPQKATKTAKNRSPLARFSQAQFAAYQKARTSAIQKAQFRNQVQRLQQRRLQGAAKAQRKVNLKYQQAVRARIKARAVSATYRQTVAGQQSKTLRLQAAHRLFQAQSVATQKQFAFLGESIHKRTTVLQTVTTKQAQSQVTKYRSAARRSVRSRQQLKPIIKKATGRPKKRVSSPFAAAGNAAGLQAARKVSTAAQSPKKPVAKSKTRKAAGSEPSSRGEWITAGNDTGTENCVAVAVANHLLMSTGYRMSDEDVLILHKLGNDTIAGCLRILSVIPAGGWRVTRARPVNPERGMLIGVELPEGAHAVVLTPGDTMVSWGQIVPVQGDVEEAWFIRWMR